MRKKEGRRRGGGKCVRKRMLAKRWGDIGMQRGEK
jgi:hypothetical protein